MSNRLQVGDRCYWNGKKYTIRESLISPAGEHWIRINYKYNIEAKKVKPIIRC